MPYDEKLFRTIGRIGAAIICAGGLAVIAGWQYRIPFLRGELLGTFIAPNTALLMVVCGVSILLQSTRQRPAQIIGSALSVPVFAFASAVFLERILGVDYAIDGLFMSHRLSDWVGFPHPGRFSFTTAVSFIFAAIALATLRLPTKTSDYSAAAVALLSYFGVIGYLYQAKLLYGRITSTYTIALFAILAISVWCSSRTLYFPRYFTGDLPGGIVARRVVSSILIWLPLLGWLEVQGRRTEFFSRETGIAFVVVSASMIFTLQVLRTARMLDEIDRRRSLAEAGLIQTEKLAAAGRMAATIAHEINNPLGAVTNLLYLCRTVDMDAATRDSYLAMAEEEVRHLALISKQTLGFYRESAEPTVFDCAGIIEQVVALYRSRVANKGIEIRQELCIDARVYCVAGELRQVLVNLVANAFDACPSSKGIIYIASRVTSDKVVLEVSDNGHGVKPEDRKRIFEAFYTTKENVGTGLGLWVSKGLIEKNAGKIEVLGNDLPFSTTFRLTLPAAKAADHSATA
jgi:signal transduction histidine kinase